MLYPVQNLDRASWTIVGGSICPHIARDLVFGSMDRQNALESIVRHDLNSTLIDTLPIVSKRPKSQFRPIPGLFQSIPDPTIPDSLKWTGIGSPALHSRAIPIHSSDLDCHAGDPRARSGTSKPLKIRSVAKRNTEHKTTENLFLNGFSYERKFISGTKIAP